MGFILNPYRYAGGGITDPTDIANLYLWLDGSDISTMWQDAAKVTPVTTDTDPIGHWEDKQTGLDFTQASAGKRPLYATNVKNGNSAVYFVSEDWLKESSTSIFNVDFTAFAVYSNATASNIAAVISSDAVDTSTDRFSFYADTRSTPKRFCYYPTDNLIDFLAQQSTSTWYYSSAIVDQSSSIEGWLNGTSQGTGTPDTAVVETDTVVGALNQSTTPSLPLVGYIGEIIVYHALLSDTDRQAVEAYLAAKWAI